MGRADQWIGIGGKGDWAVDHCFHPAITQGRNPRHRRFDNMFHRIQIRGHQISAKFWWHTINRPCFSVFFIRPKNEAITFLADIPAFFGITNNRQFRLTCIDSIRHNRHGIGHKILMQHRDRWDIEPHHFADFPSPCSCRINDMLGLDHGFFSANNPMVTGAFNLKHGVIAHDHRPARDCYAGHGIGHQRWVHMTVIRLINAANQAINLCQRMQFSNIIRRQQAKRIAGEI